MSCTARPASDDDGRLQATPIAGLGQRPRKMRRATTVNRKISGTATKKSRRDIRQPSETRALTSRAKQDDQRPTDGAVLIQPDAEGIDRR
jgi:hypothetical protein